MIAEADADAVKDFTSAWIGDALELRLRESRASVASPRELCHLLFGAGLRETPAALQRLLAATLPVALPRYGLVFV